ncbi:hypothetical protein DSM104443_03931 [Usitatibacter rugosus]|uniref:Serine phosphatase RsbU (Regulator of sigma subunit) n=1 Tax=Usitatibacter rugosus TaxID=2732067 RepID=A0A6M4H111_9PROT|nr:hypothetical protein DSM104443_03931 [Usitatibacter rugosus]
MQQPVVIVGIDEHSLREFGQWPWPRTRMGDLIRAISAGKPAAIGLDLFFPEPDRYSPGNLVAMMPGITSEAARLLMSLPTNDSLFANAITESPAPVILGISGENDADSITKQVPKSTPVRLFTQRELPIHQFKSHIGNVSVLVSAAASSALMNEGEQGAIVRRSPLVARLAGGTFGALGLETLRQGMQADLVVRDRGYGLIQIEMGEAKVLAQEDGTAWIRFGHHDDTRFVTAYDVMLGKIAEGQFENKIVLVGMMGLGVTDYKVTPLAEFNPGVEVHAQIAENLYNGVSLVRPSPMPRLEALILIVLGFLVVRFVPRTRAQYGFAIVVGGIGATLAAGLLLFAEFGILLDPIVPSLGALGAFGMMLVGTLANSERQRRQLREQAARVAGELDAAKRIQMGLLPNPAETLASERRVLVAALLEPARTVGGDFYDCFLIGDRYLFFVVADVSGKGLPAALFMASVKSQIKSSALQGGEVGAMLTRAQDEIERENPEQLFVTAFAGLLDLHSGRLEYANAGHEPPYARRPHSAPERLGESGGPPLGVVDEFRFPSAERTLVPGEWICVVTDGATEAMNPERAFFGVERLRTALGWVPDDVTPEDVIRRLRDDVRKFADGAEAPDDLTLLALQWKGN